MRSKPRLLWLDAVGCNGCSHSFLNYPEIKQLLEKFDILYHPVLDSAEFKIAYCDILVIEGALKNNFPRLGYDLIELVSKLFSKAKKVVALGTCASYGGIFGDGIIYGKKDKGRFFKCRDKVINIPGCPPHPEWIAYVLDMLAQNVEIVLDEEHRPVEIFSYTSHMGCVRSEYFEWKIDAEEFGRKEGCLFYYQGCQGPFTHSSCNRILWNEINSKPRAGTPCFGCTEKNFPKEGLFKTETFMGLPASIPLGVSKRAYFTLAGVAKSLKNERLEKRLIHYGEEDESNPKNCK